MRTYISPVTKKAVEYCPAECEICGAPHRYQGGWCSRCRDSMVAKIHRWKGEEAIKNKKTPF